MGNDDKEPERLPNEEAEPMSPRHPALPPDAEWDMAATILTGMGCGLLLPWNAFMLAADYFEELYPCQHVESNFASVNMISLLLFMFIMVLYGTKLPMGFRVVMGYGILLFALLIAIPVKVVGIHYLLVIAVGIGDALTQGSVYGFAGQLSPLHTGAVMMGNGGSGLISSGLRLLTKALVSDSYGSFTVFFLLCGCQIAFCLLGWFYLRSLPVAAHLHSSLTRAGWASCLGGEVQ